MQNVKFGLQDKMTILAACGIRLSIDLGHVRAESAFELGF